ncbi:NADH-dependent flavin oxidoreductase [Renibacterium salmoninarum ATCC 33209]|uniref:NADH-dependent flavin oxidoreductase n=1 Tax=Renibacterium salmoninarum (strain ATCC 33209 / DSM 20767 / JCM 11484 / NBRC 15589 / NCIMB 2235) TaxID=288705 RepID=A9WND8_RENSM|nr:NADH:flavin oxidoreductase/NADH oxidase [Renibacterium salmoninarum]ABY23194.1 NADH-dependent flavin oxidoreductase [Renibacterium salmoninarum ATCC 33209]
MSKLFEPLTLRGLELRHRGWVSPMCQYSADELNAPGVPNDWHLMHLGQFAAGGAALILSEATAVLPEGRISPRDTGLYNDDQAAAWRRIVDFVHQQGAVDSKIGIQLAHAGRKASTWWPFAANSGSVPQAQGGWQSLGATSEAFTGYAPPLAMSETQIMQVISAFADSARRAVQIGFDVIEIHAAHGYLLHQFLSPLVNTREDKWGGSEERRFRLTLEVVEAVRAVMPESMPLLLRVSASDWFPSGLDADAVSRLAVLAKARGVDLIDVSSGGIVAEAKIPVGPGYQTAFAQQIRREAAIPVASVGLITDAFQADHLLRTEQADAVLVARAALRNPHWWQQAAHDLGIVLPWAPQYERATPRGRF